MDNALALVNETQERKPARRTKIWRECPITDDVIFQATDECSRSGWFLRLTVSGLYPRRIGPYRTKNQALEVLEEFIASVLIEPMLDLENSNRGPQAYVIEGIPLLMGDAPRKDGDS